MNRLDDHLETFRRQDIHERGCNKHSPQPKQSGPFHYDYYVIMHCDCFLSLENPTQEEKIRILRKFAQTFDWPHDKPCPALKPKYELYRNKWHWVRMNCTCWLSKLDTPKEPVYTEPMPNDYIILPLDRKPAFFDTDRTYPNELSAINMLAYQGFSTDPNSAGYWGHDNRIVSKAEYESEKNPVVAQIKAEIDKIRANALGPHLDTPIYDALAREYDKKYNNLNYFETDLAKRLTNMRRHIA